MLWFDVHIADIFADKIIEILNMYVVFLLLISMRQLEAVLYPLANI